MFKETPPDALPSFGKLRKIIIVLSDGISSDTAAVQRVIKEFRDKGVVVVGVGITKGGEPIKTTYAPDAKVSEKASDLAVTLGDLLREYFKNL